MTHKLPQRPPSHAVSTDSDVYLRRMIPAEWTISTDAIDYGVDYRIQIFEESVPSSLFFAIQLKARSRGYPRVSLARKTLNFLALQPTPSMVVLFSPQMNEGRYMWLDMIFDHLAVQSSVTTKSDKVSILFPDSCKITDEWSRDIVVHLRDLEVAKASIHLRSEINAKALELTTCAAKVRHHLANLFSAYTKHQCGEFAEYWAEWRQDVFVQVEQIVRLYSSLATLWGWTGHAAQKAAEYLKNADEFLARCPGTELESFHSSLSHCRKQERKKGSCIEAKYIGELVTADAALAQIIWWVPAMMEANKSIDSDKQ